jgi:hypothetical protein
MPWFGGFIGDWFIGCVFFFSREREREVRISRGDGFQVIFLNLFFLNHTKRSNRNAKYVIKK